MWFISPLIWVISIVTLLMTPLISTNDPPSNSLSPQHEALQPRETQFSDPGFERRGFPLEPRALRGLLRLKDVRFDYDQGCS